MFLLDRDSRPTRVPASAVFCGLLVGTSLAPDLGLAETSGAKRIERKQVVLTQARIDGLLAAQPAFREVAGGNFYAPNPAVRPKVEAIARKYGFGSLQELHAVVDIIERVMDGIDDPTGRYVGVRRVMERTMAAIAADKDRPESGKASLLEGLRSVLTSKEAVKPSAEEIALVTKNYGRLREILGEGSN